MWWPAIGAVFVGLVGLLEPRTLSVGYSNIDGLLSGTIFGRALLILVILKFISWSLYLGSGTSGGTLAPLFTIGGGIGAVLGSLVAHAMPSLGVNPSVAGLVGMAAIFAGASQALLASVVMAFEMTRQPMGLLPLLAGCTAAYFVSLLMLRGSIMTEKLVRRGVSVQTEYQADYLAQVRVRSAVTKSVVTLGIHDRVQDVIAWLSSGEPGSEHAGYPVLDDDGLLAGVITRRDLVGRTVAPDAQVGSLLQRVPAVVFEDNTLREAADHMVREGVGRLPVVKRSAPRTLVGILSRRDLLAAHEERLDAKDELQPAVVDLRMALRFAMHQRPRG
jgi:CBS domain-containing protein